MGDALSEAILRRAEALREARKWWGFADWIAWGWSQKVQIHMLLASYAYWNISSNVMDAYSESQCTVQI